MPAPRRRLPVRVTAIRGLGKSGDEAAAPAIARAISDPVWQARAAAAEAASNVRQKELVEPLVAQMQKEDGSGTPGGEVKFDVKTNAVR